jgi:large subunit ribosomal protein L10
MAKTREQKQQAAQEIADRLGRVKSAVFTTVSGYTRDDANALREKGRGEGVEVMITKKTLLLRALADKGLETDKTQLEGSILTAFSYDDEVAGAKLMAEFAKGREGIEIVAGIMEGRLADGAEMQTLATLPSKDELYAKVVGSLNAPVSGFVNVLAGNLRSLVYALNAIKEAKA